MAGLRWRHVAFLLSTWAVVSFLALMVVGLAWTTRLKPQALADARAQRQEIVRVLARLADSQVRDKLDALVPVASQLAQSWASHEPRALQRELDGLRSTLQMPTLFVVDPDGRPLAFSPITAADGSSNLDLRYADRPLLRAAIATQRPAVSGIVFGRASRDFIVGAAVPIRVDEAAVAYLLGSIRLQASMEAIEQAAAGPGGWLVLIDGDQQAVYLDRQTRQLTQRDWKSHPVVEELAHPDADGIVDIDGDEWLLTQAMMPTVRANLVYAGSVRQILEGQRTVLLTLGATLLVSLALSLAVSTVVAVRFVREQQAAAVPGKRQAARG
ncbi:MAG TPA: cache domain-containing protein [Methylomirabilota bacterium]|nr:cache domain-containing protein [Methylomirabilota bacterium]